MQAVEERQVVRRPPRPVQQVLELLELGEQETQVCGVGQQGDAQGQVLRVLEASRVRLTGALRFDGARLRGEESHESEARPGSQGGACDQELSSAQTVHAAESL